MTQELNGSGFIHERLHRWHALAQTLMLALLALGTLCVEGPQVALCEAEWSFTLVEPGVHEHDVTKGVATIKIQNGRLTGTMRSKEGVEYKLTGTASKGHVDAKFAVIGSEVLDIPFSGTYRLKRFSSEDLGFSGLESIILTNGFAVLAIQREILR